MKLSDIILSSIIPSNCVYHCKLHVNLKPYANVYKQTVNSQIIGTVLYIFLNYIYIVYKHIYIYMLPNNILGTQKSLTKTSSDKKQDRVFIKVQVVSYLCVCLYIFYCALMLSILYIIMEKKISQYKEAPGGWLLPQKEHCKVSVDIFKLSKRIM